MNAFLNSACNSASLPFVRKLSADTNPSNATEEASDQAADDTPAVARRRTDSLTTTAPPKNREEVAAEKRAKSALRFAR